MQPKYKQTYNIHKYAMKEVASHQYTSSNDLLFYIMHPIFDNIFCTNIEGRQVFSKCVPWYLPIQS